MANFIPSKGTIIYDDFNIDFTKPVKCQKDFLKEDLLQISLPDDLILDLGWYPECSVKGHFIIQIIKSYNWESPIYKKSFNYSSDIYQKINEALNTI